MRPACLHPNLSRVVLLLGVQAPNRPMTPVRVERALQHFLEARVLLHNADDPERIQVADGVLRTGLQPVLETTSSGLPR